MIATSSYHPSGNGGVERVNHTMAQMLAMVGKERQDDLDAQLPHVEFSYNNSVSAATDLAPNEVPMGRLPRLLLTIFDRSGVASHQSSTRDHLAYCDLAADRQQRANDIARKMRALTVSRVERRNSALSDALRQVPNFVVGNWVWLYIQHGLNYSPKCEGRHRCESAQDQVCAQLDGPLQYPGGRSLSLRRHTRRFPPRGQTPLFGSPHGHAGRGRASPRVSRALQALYQPSRPRRHA